MDYQIGVKGHIPWHSSKFHDLQKMWALISINTVYVTCGYARPTGYVLIHTPQPVT